MNVLVFAAHPDDEILGMGGTIKKYSKKGHNVSVVILATGIFARRSTSYRNSPKYSSDKKTQQIAKKQLEKLRNDAKRANKIVGVKNLDLCDFPDNEMDIISNLEVTKKIEEKIKKYNPSIVFTHSSSDINVDHRIIYNATITATRPMENSKINKVISYEVPSSTEWNFPSVFSPNIFIDIYHELSFKLKAMACYKDELRKFPHPRSLKGLEIIAKRWGTVSGYKAAEAFSLVRELNNKL